MVYMLTMVLNGLMGDFMLWIQSQSAISPKDGEVIGYAYSPKVEQHMHVRRQA
jgi:hypothetical protein